MMIRDKIIGCARPTLFIVFSILLGCANTIEAKEMDLATLLGILSDSNQEVKISDMLIGTQVDELKALKEIQDIKSAKRQEMRITTANAVTGGKIMPGSLQDKLMVSVEEIVGRGSGGVGGILGGITNITNRQKSFSDPSNLKGLAVRFAPSDEELFQENGK